MPKRGYPDQNKPVVRIPFFYCSNYDTMIISKTFVEKSIRQTEHKTVWTEQTTRRKAQTFWQIS